MLPTVTVVRPAERDNRGVIEGEPDEHELVGAVTAPRSSSSTTEHARNGAVVGLVLYAPPGSDIVRTDLVRVGDDLYRVDGEIGTWTSPYSDAVDGIEVALRRGEG